jgi:pyroglutamyl-peptidase
MKSTAVKLHLTGFGPFLNVTDNPSSRIARRILELHSESKGVEAGRTAAPFELADFEVLEVSIAGVDAYFHQQRDKLELLLRERATPEGAKAAAEEEEIHLFIHLGVYRGLKDAIRLETKCFNEAHFPSGDFNGVIKDHEPIERDEKGLVAPSTRQTTLPLQEFMALLQAGSAPTPRLGPWFCLTDDPGRYLCNYCFYRSCQLTAECTEKVRASPALTQLHSLFIHVSDGDGPLSIEGQSQLIYGWLVGLAAFLAEKIPARSDAASPPRQVALASGASR